MFFLRSFWVAHAVVLWVGTARTRLVCTALATNCMPRLPLLTRSCFGWVHCFVQGVAAIVARRVAADAAAGVLEAQRSAALVDRKVVKQTVMTSVYGVTPVGARAQIENRLKERRTDMKHKAARVAEQGSGSSSNNGWLLAASGMAAAAAAAGGASSGAAAAAGAAAGAGRLGVVARGMRDEYSWMDDKDVVWQVGAAGVGGCGSCGWMGRWVGGLQVGVAGGCGRWVLRAPHCSQGFVAKSTLSGMLRVNQRQHCA
jgi:hypothetical protein